MRRPAWVVPLLALSAAGCPASLEPMQVKGLAAEVKLTHDKTKVDGCRAIGTVEGWRDAEKQNRAYVLAAKNGAYAAGARPHIYVLFRDGEDDEVYVCGGATQASAAAPSGPTTLSPHALEPVIVAEKGDVKGCTYLGAIEGRDLLHGDAQGYAASVENARRNLIANAKKLLADTILVSHETACVQLGMCTAGAAPNPSTSNAMNRQGAANSRNTFMEGEAYSCPATPAPTAQ